MGLAKHTGGLSVVAASGSFSCTAAGGQPPKYHMCLTEDAQQHAQRLQSMVAMGLPAGWAAHALRLKQDAVENAVLWMFEEGHNNAEPTAEPVAQPEQVIAC